MKRTIFILFILMYSIPPIKSQTPQVDSTNFFFKVAFDSLGVCYGKCLTQAEWDIVDEEIIIKDEFTGITPKKEITHDTLKFDFYFLYKNTNNLKYIINSIDTSQQIIMIKEERRIKPACPPEILNNCYSTFSEDFIETPSYEKWNFKNNQNIANSNNWELSITKEIYDTRTRKVITTPDCCGFREEIIPAEYITVIRITPNKKINEYELNNIKLLCKKEHILQVEKIKYEKEIITPAKTKIEKKKILRKPATTELRKIFYEITPSLILKIQKQLYALGFYSGSFQGEFNDETKAAIIKYQAKNNLPIGQLDNETVEHILSRKTPFQN